MYFPKDIYSLRLVYEYVVSKNIDYFIIGNGTNLVINESYFNKLFISLKELNKIYYLKNNKVLMLAGINASKASFVLAKKGYTKQEYLSVIPGSIGGAIYMNAGAYSSDISNIIKSVLVIEENKLKLLSKEECKFGYRKSMFMDHRNIIIVGGIFCFEKTKNKEKPLEKIRAYISNKRNNQPLNLKSAGSTFKNPKGISAWEVVDKLGYRGKVLGGAKVSEKHPNFLINQNHASFSDIYNLMLEITLKAKEVYNIDLECEWEILK